MPVAVTRARRSDHDAIVRVLARAFDTDPVANYLFRQDAGRGRAFELAFGAFLKHATMPHGETWLADGAVGAALWVPPLRWNMGLGRTLAMAPALVRAIGLTRVRQMAAAADRVHRRHPHSPPHYYLFAIGVDPEHQGRGIGAALLHVVLDRCDAEGVPAYLEASKPENRRLYERHGFSVTEEVSMAPDAPPMWLMWREARL
jgi:ribosomal protein S18 acetylase RimI-like enzyme